MGFVKIMDRAQFLFGRNVLEYVTELRQSLIKLGYATTMLEGAELTAEQRQVHLQQRHDCMLKVAKAYDEMPKLMSPYILMDQKRPGQSEGSRGTFDTSLDV